MAKIRITEIREFDIDFEEYENITAVEDAFEYEKEQYQNRAFDVYDLTDINVVQSTFELIEENK